MNHEDRFTISQAGSGLYFACKKCGSMQWVDKQTAKYSGVIKCACEGEEYWKQVKIRRRNQMWNDPNRPH